MVTNDMCEGSMFRLSRPYLDIVKVWMGVGILDTEKSSRLPSNNEFTRWRPIFFSGVLGPYFVL